MSIRFESVVGLDNIVAGLALEQYNGIFVIGVKDEDGRDERLLLDCQVFGKISDEKMM